MTAKKQVRLALLCLAPGSHTAAWRHPNCDPGAHMDIGFFRRMVETAERGRFDMLFLADTLASIGSSHTRPEMFERAPYGILEPMTLLAALSTYTRHLGLVSTMSASVQSPHHIARVFGSLDHLSGGRAGWNVITTQSTVERSLTTAPLGGKEAQYERAMEVAQCVFDFWDSWAEDSFPRDKEACRFVSLEKARIPDREGKYFKIEAPLNQPRPPQGRPVIVQAGMSDAGLNMGAQIADISFTIQPTLTAAKAFYKDMKARVARAGRNPDRMIILPGILPFVGRTRAEAEALRQQMLACVDIDATIAEIRHVHSVDLGVYDLDGPVPELEGFANARNSGFFRAVELVRAEHPGITVRGLLQKLASGRGHQEVAGTAEDIADWIEEWVDEEGCDGLLVQPPLFPDDLDRFVDLVIPELQRRGRFRTDYEHTTLRGNLGLPIPRR